MLTYRISGGLDSQVTVEIIKDGNSVVFTEFASSLEEAAVKAQKILISIEKEMNASLDLERVTSSVPIKELSDTFCDYSHVNLSDMNDGLLVSYLKHNQKTKATLLQEITHVVTGSSKLDVTSDVYYTNHQKYSKCLALMRYNATQTLKLLNEIRRRSARVYKTAKYGQGDLLAGDYF